ncbi:hypothetical protein [Pseudomonas sp. Irchel 3E13]|jgi:hypothetical protein|uniref:HNH endonuclease n=1 Tax=Pseudomonas sp. Irchel 3E13 TaxID=2008975 RepID=UPI0015A93E15|nr:hypothetical protein [Pseudomonas sp. Irchel 3E13]
MAQFFQIIADNGSPIDAHFGIESDEVVFHSRGGTKGKGAINSEYALGLSVLLTRLKRASFLVERVWVDSSRVQGIPISQRTILTSGESKAPVDQVMKVLSTRMKAVGRSSSESSGGNSTRRIRMTVSGGDAQALNLALGGTPVDKNLRSLERLPAEVLRGVTAEYIWRAVQDLISGIDSPGFAESTDYDLIVDEHLRLPPKAVFGLAATRALGFQILPRHFTAGVNSVCFQLLEDAGFRIVPKGALMADPVLPSLYEDQVWTEGQSRLVAHLRKERAPGLSIAKKAEFKKNHGRLYCERCKMDPVETYGAENGEACIEVHHRTVQIAQMAPRHLTSLEDLQCLCASCHRVVHRELSGG